MKPLDELMERKRPARQPVQDSGNRSPILFLTLCSKDRKRLFAFADVHELLVRTWRAAAHWRVGRYMVMPDHIHLFAAPATLPPGPVRAWVKYWKTLVSREWPRPNEHPLWQQDAWDTQLRRGEHYAEKWEYIRNNPVRAGLVSTSEEWPFQGELNMLEWHDE